MTDLPKLRIDHDVFLLRHGETEWNRYHRIQGRKNSDLTERGRAQARQQERILRSIRPALGPHRLWASPLGRAQETARLAFAGSDFSTDPRLAEISCGTWEGTTHEERVARDPLIVAGLDTEFDVYTSGPGAENAQQIGARLASFLSELTAPAIIVSHKVAIVVIRSLLTPDPLDCSLVPEQGSILKISGGAVRHHYKEQAAIG
ncbi:histidine phosphatase family protein [Sedimentitalea sp. XS_ASV28]|uniref:histidine phosphatase family protein n=1 Tax=Sedimentitalea sp. XS_ASV28 TaxID=3241296 RepID=UPI0035122F07